MRADLNAKDALRGAALEGADLNAASRPGLKLQAGAFSADSERLRSKSLPTPRWLILAKRTEITDEEFKGKEVKSSRL